MSTDTALSARWSTGKGTVTWTICWCVVDKSSTAAGHRRAADVRIRDGVIVEVAPGLHPDGEPVLDADGASVTPGFIDVHTHYDGAMWWGRARRPDATARCTCACGRRRYQPHPARLAGSPTATGLAGLHVLLHRRPPHRARRQRGPLDVVVVGRVPRAFNARARHIAALVGHNLRMSVLGGESFDREATDDERVPIPTCWWSASKAARYGASLSFVDSDSHGRRCPRPHRQPRRTRRHHRDTEALATARQARHPAARPPLHADRRVT